ncbi:hypothetical protein LCI18_008753 [Fusarium solani-melongenae]|uniref:Uncharacterized protein n=1 Tax=Fusarium solani subsp. cucurbitae TaxID=2747967 RepID=A0ACD3ZCL7_FUSSC|nr:hypothetical protein LCI18_008753 [Fusarium solani-melongenae]
MPIAKDQASPVTQAVAVVDRSADVELAAKKITSSKFVFGGRGEYSPDYVMVNEFVQESFIHAVLRELSNIIVPEPRGEKPRNGNPTVSRKTEKSQASGILGLADDEASKGLKVIVNDERGSIIGVADSFTSLDDAIDIFAPGCEKIQALYVFSAPAEAKYLAQFIPSRVGFANHIPSELLGIQELP